MTHDEWKAYVADEPARKADEIRCSAVMAQLAEAERLLFDEGYTFDDPWPGIIYQRGTELTSVRRVDIEVWVLMRALMRGMGEAGIRRASERVP